MEPEPAPNYGAEILIKMSNNPTGQTTTHYFHGTEPANLPRILAEGFQIQYDTLDHGQRKRRQGTFGYGTYVTNDWKVALEVYQCRALLRVEIAEHARLLDLSPAANPKTIRSLEREFGKQLLKQNCKLHKTLPANKQLTCAELIELTRHHYHMARCAASVSLNQCLKMLRLYKFDGVGEADSMNGLVLFSPQHVRVVELITILPKHPFNLWPGQNYPTLPRLRNDFKRQAPMSQLELAAAFQQQSDSRKTPN